VSRGAYTFANARRVAMFLGQARYGGLFDDLPFAPTRMVELVMDIPRSKLHVFLFAAVAAAGKADARQVGDGGDMGCQTNLPNEEGESR